MELTKKTENGTCTIAIEGRLDTNTSATLQKALEEWGGEEPSNLLLDFDKLDFITSYGLRCIIMAKRTATKQGKEIQVINAKQKVKEVFEITGLSSLVATS